MLLNLNNASKLLLNLLWKCYQFKKQKTENICKWEEKEKNPGGDENQEMGLSFYA